MHVGQAQIAEHQCDQSHIDMPSGVSGIRYTNARCARSLVVEAEHRGTKVLRNRPYGKFGSRGNVGINVA